jgi:hypothetical protein
MGKGDQKTDQKQAAKADGAGSTSALPFEPVSSKKKAGKKATTEPTSKSKNTSSADKAGAGKSSAGQPDAKKAAAIAKGKALAAEMKASKGAKAQGAKASGKTMPKEVGDRMARRMAFFCGIPSFLGMATFVVSYILVNQGTKIPNVAVVLVSMLFFGLGVLGLSYGVISASWDEGRDGTLLGWGEFRTNFGRLVGSWKEARELAKQEKG